MKLFFLVSPHVLVHIGTRVSTLNAMFVCLIMKELPHFPYLFTVFQSCASSIIYLALLKYMQCTVNTVDGTRLHAL